MKVTLVKFESANASESIFEMSSMDSGSVIECMPAHCANA